MSLCGQVANEDSCRKQCGSDVGQKNNAISGTPSHGDDRSALWGVLRLGRAPSLRMTRGVEGSTRSFDCAERLASESLCCDQDDRIEIQVTLKDRVI